MPLVRRVIPHDAVSFSLQAGGEKHVVAIVVTQCSPTYTRISVIADSEVDIDHFRKGVRVGEAPNEEEGKSRSPSVIVETKSGFAND